MGSPTTTPFPEWEQARRRARPEDEAQRRLVAWLELPIGSEEIGRLAARKLALQEMADTIPPPVASRLYRRLADPRDALGQFLRFEVTAALRDDLVNRLAARERAGARGTDVSQRGTPIGAATVPYIPKPYVRPTENRSTGTTKPFVPPLVVPVECLPAPQYYANGLVPYAVDRPVWLVPAPKTSGGPCIKPPTGPGIPTRPPGDVLLPVDKDEKQKREKEERERKEREERERKRKAKRNKDEHKDDKNKDDNDTKKGRPKGQGEQPSDPEVINWIKDQTQKSGHVASVVAPLLTALSPVLVSLSIYWMTMHLRSGGTIARAGEIAAKQILLRRLKSKGITRVFDLNSKWANFPGLDLISADRGWQVKMWGVFSNEPKSKVAGRIVNDIMRLYGWEPNRWHRNTVKRLLRERVEIENRGAWPTALSGKYSEEEGKVLAKAFLQQTVYAQPDDLVPFVKSGLGEKLASNPKFRESIPELRLGNEKEIKELGRDAQKQWAGRVSAFLDDRVVGIGATTDQLREMAIAAQQIPDTGAAPIP